MSVIGVVPQQAVHVCVKKSYDDLLKAEPLNTIGSAARRDPSNHPVVSNDSHFIGVLPDNSAIYDSNKNKPKAISVQVSGLCSACIAYPADKKADSLVMGMPLLFDKNIGLYVDDAKDKQSPVGKFIDLVEEEYYPEHGAGVNIGEKNANFYHAIIHLNGIAQHKDTPANNKRYKLSALPATVVAPSTPVASPSGSSTSPTLGVATPADPDAVKAAKELTDKIQAATLAVTEAEIEFTFAQKADLALDSALNDIPKRLDAATYSLAETQKELETANNDSKTTELQRTAIENRIKAIEDEIETIKNKGKALAQQKKNSVEDLTQRVEELNDLRQKLQTLYDSQK